MTERDIRDATAGEKPIIIWDDKVMRFGCKVYPSGLKAYVISYRVDGKLRLATIGRGEMSLAEARKKAGAELNRIRNGEVDPLARKRSDKEAPTRPGRA